MAIGTTSFGVSPWRHLTAPRHCGANIALAMAALAPLQLRQRRHRGRIQRRTRHADYCRTTVDSRNQYRTEDSSAKSFIDPALAAAKIVVDNNVTRGVRQRPRNDTLLAAPARRYHQHDPARTSLRRCRRRRRLRPTGQRSRRTWAELTATFRARLTRPCPLDDRRPRARGGPSTGLCALQRGLVKKSPTRLGPWRRSSHVRTVRRTAGTLGDHGNLTSANVTG